MNIADKIICSYVLRYSELFEKKCLYYKLITLQDKTEISFYFNIQTLLQLSNLRKEVKNSEMFVAEGIKNRCIYFTLKVKSKYTYTIRYLTKLLSVDLRLKRIC